MNICTAFSRILPGVVMVASFNMAADIMDELAKPMFIAVGSLVVPTKLPEGEQGKVIIAKACCGGAGYLVDELFNTESKASSNFGINNCHKGREYRSAAHKAVVYTSVNASLRLAANNYFLNEKYINQKCDEYLSEDVAWIAKPVANIAVDLAYNYVTVQMVKGFVDSIKKS